MLFRKAVCMGLLVFVALAAPVASQRMVSQNALVIRADGGAPAPPPMPWLSQAI